MTEPAVAPSRSGSRWKLFLRIFISAALLIVLIYKAPHPDLPRQHHTLTFSLLAAAVVVALIGVVLSAWRWQRVLMVFGVRLPVRQLTSHYFVGLFVGNVLPSTIGGDVVRVSRASTATGSSEVAFASVVLERMTGFVGLPLLVLIGFAAEPSLIQEHHAWIALLVAGGTVAVLGLLLLLVGHPRLAGRFEGNPGWTRFLAALHQGIAALRRRPSQIFPLVSIAFLYQLSSVVVFALIFRALDLPISIAAVFAFAPAVLMLQVLPISLSGLGVREGALILFLHPLAQKAGVPDGRIIAAGLLWYACMLLVSVIGAPAFAVGQRARIPETTT
jgi:uncharacterized membrane protein YbhN (UPF0104 family)